MSTRASRRLSFDDLVQALEQPWVGSSDFDLNPDVVVPRDRTLRPAAVLIPVFDDGSDLQVFLTKRSSALKHHPGQIAFPGGKIDPGDRDPQAAALREAHEEIALVPENVEVLGTLPSHETVTSYSITPVLGRVRADFVPRADPAEVAEVFSVPLDHVLNVGRYSVQYRRWRGVRRSYYTVPYGPYYIWGATARILRGLADQVR